MAKRKIEAEVAITATDDASTTIQRLERRIDGLESDEARITVSANVDKLETQLDNARRKLADLDGDEASVQARLVGNLESDLDEARRLFERLDGQSGTVRIDADTRDARREIGALGDDIDDLVDRAGELPGVFGALGGAIRGGPGGGLVGAAGAVGAVFGTAVARTVELATEVQRVATVLDITTEEASRLTAVFADAGIEANDLQDIALQITGALDGNAELAAKLQISLEDAAEPAEALRAAVDRWDFLTATERAQAFGEEGVRQIGNLIAQGEDLETLLANVDARRIFSDEDVENARRLAVITAEFKAEVDALAISIGGPLVDAIGEFDAAVDKVVGGGGFSDLFGGALDLARGDYRAVAERWLQLGRDSGDAYSEGIRSSITDAVEGAAAEIQRLDELEPSFELSQTGITETTQLLEQLGRRGSVAMDDLADSGDDVSRAYDGLGAEIADSFAGAVDEVRSLRDEIREAIASADELRSTIRSAPLEAETQFLDLADQIDKVRDALRDVAEAESSEDRQKAIRDYRREQIRLTEDLYDYLDALENVPERTFTEITALINEGDYQAVQARLDELTGGLFTTLTVDIKVNDIPDIEFSVAPGRAPQQITPGQILGLPAGFTGVTPTVNIYNPAATPAATAENADRYYLRNADRYRF